MKRTLCIALLVLGLLAGAGQVSALDTSPYLVGFTENYVQDSGDPYWNHWQIVNPTTKLLDVWVVWYRPWEPSPCAWMFQVPANGTTWLMVAAMVDLSEGYQALKFFAFPAGSRKFDPNAVIGGFQRKSHLGTVEPANFNFMSEANLKAVTINSSTIGEFSAIPWNTTCWGGG